MHKVELDNGNIQLYHGDCLEVMPTLFDKSVDMVLADLPYGTTHNKWDSIIHLDTLWEQYNRIIKTNKALVFTAKQPFTSTLILSNTKLFKYSLIWNKFSASSGIYAKKQPLRIHEDICVFSKGKPPYNPQMTIADRRIDKPRNISNSESFTAHNSTRAYDNAIRSYDNNGLKYPKSIIDISNANQFNKVHPTQKPVALMEYLIKTYTNVGDLVLDNVFGSGSTAIACLNTNRRFIGIEKEEKYFDIAVKRCEDALKEKKHA